MGKENSLAEEYIPMRKRIHDEVEMEYLMEDAKNQMLEYLGYYMGCREKEELVELIGKAPEGDLEDFPFDKIAEACGETEESLFKELACKFQRRKDCNIADNDTWRFIIEEKISEVLKAKKGGHNG